MWAAACLNKKIRTPNGNIQAHKGCLEKQVKRVLGIKQAKINRMEKRARYCKDKQANPAGQGEKPRLQSKAGVHNRKAALGQRRKNEGNRQEREKAQAQEAPENSFKKLSGNSRGKSSN